MTNSSNRVAIYCRISRDSEGRSLGVARQEEDCRKRAEREGWEVVAVFTDNDVSASGRSTKPRPQYEALIAAVEAGEVGRVLAYSSSRLTRRPAELEEWITRHEKTGVLIHCIADGDIDFSKSDGVLQMRIRASIDAAEAQRTSERVLRAQQQARESGTYAVQRSFGWKNQTDLEPTEAEAVREGIRALLEGGTLTGIAKSWHSAGFTTVRGTKWTSQKVHRLMTRGRNAGLVEHKGKVLEGVTGAWEPICSREDYEAVVSILSDPVRRTNKGAGPKSLLVGAVWCGAERNGEVCGLRMTRAKRSDGALVYRCSDRTFFDGDSRCSNSITLAIADEFVVGEVTYGLVMGHFDSVINPDVRAMDELGKLRRERAELTAHVDSLVAEMDSAGALEMRAILGMSKKLDEQREALNVKIASLERGMPARELYSWVVEEGWWNEFLEDPTEHLERHSKVAEAWEKLSLDKQRAVIQSLVRVEVLSSAGGKVRGTERLRVMNQ